MQEIPLWVFLIMLLGDCYKNASELLSLRALFFSLRALTCLNIMHIFQCFHCMGNIFCVEFQRVPLKFHTKYLTHTLKDTICIQYCNFKTSYMFLKCPQGKQRCWWLKPSEGDRREGQFQVGGMFINMKAGWQHGSLGYHGFPHQLDCFTVPVYWL